MNNSSLDYAMENLKKAVEANKNGNSFSNNRYKGHYLDRSGLTKNQFNARKSAGKYSYR